jgi:hypothetical protein
VRQPIVVEQEDGRTLRGTTVRGHRASVENGTGVREALVRVASERHGPAVEEQLHGGGTHRLREATRVDGVRRRDAALVEVESPDVRCCLAEHRCADGLGLLDRLPSIGHEQASAHEADALARCGAVDDRSAI